MELTFNWGSPNDKGEAIDLIASPQFNSNCQSIDCNYTSYGVVLPCVRMFLQPNKPLNPMKIHHTFLMSAVLLAGCGTTTEQWNNMFQEANSMNTGQRNYVTNPITAPVQSQPSLQPVGASGEEYRTVMVNTPNGIVYKRCKVLDGQNVACF